MTARLPVAVSSVQTWFYMLAYVKKSLPGSTKLPTSPHLLSPSQPLYSYQRDIHLIIVCGAPRAYGLAGQQFFSISAEASLPGVSISLSLFPSNPCPFPSIFRL